MYFMVAYGPELMPIFSTPFVRVDVVSLENKNATMYQIIRDLDFCLDVVNYRIQLFEYLTNEDTNKIKNLQSYKFEIMNLFQSGMMTRFNLVCEFKIDTQNPILIENIPVAGNDGFIKKEIMTVMSQSMFTHQPIKIDFQVVFHQSNKHIEKHLTVPTLYLFDF